MSCKSCVQKNINQTRQINSRSVNRYTNALMTGKKWNKTNLTYYFYKSTDDGKSDPEAAKDWNETQKNNWRTAIKSWEDVSILNFTEVNNINNADIKLILIDDDSYPYLGHAYFPDGYGSGENYVSYNNATDKNFTVGSYDYITMVHELGHTLGLAHPHDNGGTSITFPGVNSWSDLGKNQQNQTVYTVMSYNDLNGTITPDNVQSFGFVKGPMAYDIKAIQTIYGGNVSKNEDDNTYHLPTQNPANILVRISSEILRPENASRVGGERNGGRSFYLYFLGRRSRYSGLGFVEMGSRS